MPELGTISFAIDFGGPFWGLPGACIVGRHSDGPLVAYLGWLYLAIIVTWTPAGDDE